MEHDKFENQLKEKLEERRLKPSEDLWQRIENQLPEIKQKTNNTAWYWIAASLIILLVAVNLLSNRKKQLETPIEVVNEQVKAPEKTEEEKIIPQVLDNNQEVITSIKPPENDQPKKHKIYTVESNAVVADVIKTKNILVAIDSPIKTHDFEGQKAVEIVTEIKALQKTGEVTDAEIEALLSQVQKEIDSQKILIKNSRVDAMALLLDAEAELDRPLKEKVFEMLKQGFEKAKTVVAKRD